MPSCSMGETLSCLLFKGMDRVLPLDFFGDFYYTIFNK